MLDYTNNHDGTVTVYPPLERLPAVNREAFAVRLDETDLRLLLRDVENS